MLICVSRSGRGAAHVRGQKGRVGDVIVGELHAEDFLRALTARGLRPVGALAPREPPRILDCQVVG
jgi:hypothetical protein